MTLLDRFRPKWKHSDPEVRLASVRQLGSESQETLSEIARTDEDARVRRAAVKRLEDLELLRQLAGDDADEKVRTAARERASALLVALASGDDPVAAAGALERLSEAAELLKLAQGARLAQVRQQAVARLGEPGALAEVVRGGGELELRLAALGRIADPAVLRGIAGQSEHGDIALAALERIDDRQALLALAEKAQVKAVRKAAQARLDALPGQPSSPAEPAATPPADPASADIHSGIADKVSEAVAAERAAPQTAVSTTGAAEEMTAETKAADVEVSEEVVVAGAGPAQPVAAETEQAEALGGVAETGEAAADEAVAVEAVAVEAVAVEAVAVEAVAVEAAADEAVAVETAADEAVADEAMAVEVVEVVEVAVEAAVEDEPEPEPELAPPASADEAAVRFAELCQQAEQLASAEELGGVARRWARLRAARERLMASFTPTEELAQRFAAAEQQVEERLSQAEKQHRQHQKQQLDRLLALCNHLEALAAAEDLNLRKAERKLRDAQAVLKDADPDLPSKQDWQEIRHRLEVARQVLAPKVHELAQLEEWKRWANVPVQEQLCEQAEALLAREDLNNVAQELRQAQEAWKKVAVVPREKSEELWQRFKTAGDQLREKLQGFFAEQDRQRHDNLQRKLALCTRAEELCESTDWVQTAEEFKQLQAEWKDVGPVPRKQSEVVWKRFRKACDLFFERRKTALDELHSERDENLHRKQALCARAEELAESTDWDRTTDELKRMQAEWKAIGPVPRKYSETLWKRFRTACDRFFERRGRREEVPLEDNLRAREAICADLEALVASPHAPVAEAGEVEAMAGQAEAAAEPVEAMAAAALSTEPPADLVDRIREAMRAWQQAGDVPQRMVRLIQDRYRRACARLMAAYPEQLAGSELDPAVHRARRERLCERIEALVARRQEQAPAPDTGNMKSLAEQLKAALAANTIRRGATTGDAAPSRSEEQAEVRRIQAAWDDLPGVPEVELLERFHQARKHLAARV